MLNFFQLYDFSLFVCISSLHPILPAENNIHVHDLLTFQQITVVSKAKGATLFACDLQVSSSPLVITVQRFLDSILALLLLYNAAIVFMCLFCSQQCLNAQY